MDKSTVTLELFRQAINTQADAEAEEITRSADEKRAAAEQEHRTRSASSMLDDIKAEQLRISAKYRKELSRCDFEMKKAVLSHRSSLIEEYFNEAEKRLAAFTESPDYAEYLRKAVRQAEELLGEGTQINARPCDAEAVRAAATLPVHEDNSIVLGGISAANESRGLFADFTLDSRLKDEKAAFADKSELRL